MLKALDKLGDGLRLAQNRVSESGSGHILGLQQSGSGSGASSFDLSDSYLATLFEAAIKRARAEFAHDIERKASIRAEANVAVGMQSSNSKDFALHASDGDLSERSTLLGKSFGNIDPILRLRVPNTMLEAELHVPHDSRQIQRMLAASLSSIQTSSEVSDDFFFSEDSDEDVYFDDDSSHSSSWDSVGYDSGGSTPSFTGESAPLLGFDIVELEKSDGLQFHAEAIQVSLFFMLF